MKSTHPSFRVSLDQFIRVMLSVVVVSGVVFSVPSQEIGWNERLPNDLYCIEWDVKP